MNVLALLSAATAASAQAATGHSPTEADTSFFTVWIMGGGGIGWVFLLPIEILSMATLAAIIEHFVTLQRDKLVPPDVAVELETLLDEDKHEEAAKVCAGNRNYLTNIVGSALAKRADGYDSMRGAAETATDEENLKLSHKISWLVLFGNLGPMLGLFGTVTGMVMAFTVIAESKGTPSPQQLALGIFTALVTTVWGLLVAMPALGFFYIFKMKVQRLTFELSAVAMDMVERFKNAPAKVK